MPASKLGLFESLLGKESWPVRENRPAHDMDEMAYGLPVRQRMVFVPERVILLFRQRSGMRGQRRVKIDRGRRSREPSGARGTLTIERG